MTNLKKYAVELAFPVWIEAKDPKDAEMRALRAATAGVFDEVYHKNVQILNPAYLLEESAPTQLPN